jgi:hypothetical protein
MVEELLGNVALSKCWIILSEVVFSVFVATESTTVATDNTDSEDAPVTKIDEVVELKSSGTVVVISFKPKKVVKS